MVSPDFTLISVRQHRAKHLQLSPLFYFFVQHLALMRNKGILKKRREGVSIYYSLANPKVITACDIMREVLFEYLNEKQLLTQKVKF